MADYLYGIVTGIVIVVIPVAGCSYYYAKNPGKFMRQLMRQAAKRGS